jgi:RNA polymerase sigma factor for flagellar operon FliA
MAADRVRSLPAKPAAKPRGREWEPSEGSHEEGVRSLPAKPRGRDALVERHMHLVYSIAAKLQRRLGKTMEPGDLVAYGTQGLIEAAKKYDPSQGAAFGTFAYYRIRGAMFDGMRAMAWYSRSDYARFRAEERENEYLASAADRDAAERVSRPSSASADKGELLEEIAEILGGVAAVHLTTIEAARDVPDEKFKAADEAVATAEERERVREALRQLPKKERRLIELYYFSDMNLEAAGAKLGLSKSWASRLHARAVDRLREALAGEASCMAE